ncbi:RagB/SusD family nutrient uptake outer membrane protein [Salinibacter ruber]|uniref:RagB/SusD family nutrient uptake outer membrane protein n=1 Tax=Salinibacter ruber TaxID=146919 RepID=UPI0013C2FCE5|nr:RagB/SusD family nutrient uptake outer membrane protein [Salinibacter ruber]
MNYSTTIRTLLVALAAVGLLGLTACDQTIDKDPEQSLPIDQVFQDVSGAQSALTGAYSGLQADGVYGGFQVMAGDFTADIATFDGSFTTWQQAAAFNVSSTHGPTDNIWDDHYDVINRANLIIENAPNIEGADQGQIDDLVGQAKFIRALSYFNLVRWFAQPYEPGASNDQPGVILQTDGVQSTDPDFNQPRASVGDIYGQIRTDLEDAISRLDVKAERIRAGQAVANALLAKVSLYQGRYDEAAARADTIITERDGFTLSDDPTVPYANESNPEIIFSTSFSSIDNSGTNAFMSSFYLPSDFGGRGDITANSQFLSDAESGDRRATATTGLGLSDDNPGPEIKGDNLLYSYGDGGGTPAAWTNKWTNPNFGDDMPVLRVAEMYLIRAEGRVRGSGSASDARDDVNAIRSRAGLNNVSSSLSGQALIDEIIQQRRYELAFEGDRRHDLQRLGRPITSGSGTVQPGDSQRILPIPAREIEVNDALDQSSQNPGY